MLSYLPHHQAIFLSADGRQVLPESCTDMAHTPQGQCVAVMEAEGAEGAEGAERDREGQRGAERGRGGQRGAEGAERHH